MKDYWTRTDYENGLINDVGMIGLPVFPDPPVIEAEPEDDPEPAAPESPAPSASTQPMTRAERKVKLQSVVDKIIHYADAHPEAMLDDNGAQINKLMDLFSKMDDREEEAPALGKLSAADLQKMSISDLKLLLVRVVMEYVPEDRREAALAAFRPELMVLSLWLHPAASPGTPRQCVLFDARWGRSVGRHLCGRQGQSTWPAGRHPCQ